MKTKPTLSLPQRGPLFSRASGSAFILALLAVCMLVPVLNLMVPAGHVLHMSDFAVALVGKIMCYAICALAMDLIWGYTGILSLGHGLFFAIGGYAMGMYLMRQIGQDGNYKSHLPDFMVFLDWKELPWHWALSDSFVATLCLVVLVPAVVSLPHQGRLLFHHHAGHDLRGHAVVLSKRDRFWRQQRLYRFQTHSEHAFGNAEHAHGFICADRLILIGLLCHGTCFGEKQVWPCASSHTRR